MFTPPALPSQAFIFSPNIFSFLIVFLYYRPLCVEPLTLSRLFLSPSLHCVEFRYVLACQKHDAFVTTDDCVSFTEQSSPLTM